MPGLTPLTASTCLPAATTSWRPGSWSWSPMVKPQDYSSDQDRQRTLARILAALPAGTPILVSACLLGEPCRYDGRDNGLPAVRALADRFTLCPICPEVAGGLPIPRPPAERQGRAVRTAAGEDVTAAYRLGAAKALALARDRGIRLAILKAKSPSCGRGQVYDGTFSRRLVPGDGVTTETLKAEGIQVFTEKDFLA
ncbi:2-thiouracil desulfurase family protein [Peptococcus simiae]|uniref:DUF523 domain-containing protein n=1 Tax=Peptococcus simiae TaxID=1643805 RepID=UPI0039803698